MKPQALVLLLVVAAIAVAGWFAFRHGDPVAPGGAGLDKPAMQQGDAPVVPAAAAGAVTEQAILPTAIEAGADLSRSAAPDVAPDPTGAALVHGRLVDRAGAPRPGVVLELSHRKAQGGDLEFASIEAGVPSPGKSLQQDKCTTTVDGRFEFRMPTSHHGRLHLMADGLVFAEDYPGIYGRDGDRDLGALVAVQAGRLAGFVRNRAGQPIADVLVEAHLGMMGIRSLSNTRTAADGSFEVGMLKPGKWSLQTKSSRFKATTQQFELAAEEQRADLVIELDVGGSIAGRVIDDRGVPVAGCKVGARRQQTIGGMEIESFSGGEAATTAADGTFLLAGLDGETATLRAIGDGHTTTTLPGVAIGTNGLDMRVERLGSIAGVLVGTDGKPIAGSKVIAATAVRSQHGEIIEEGGLMSFGEGRSRAVTDEQGRFVIDNVRPGTMVVQATGDGHRPVDKPGVLVAPAAAITGLRLVADPGATVRVAVVDEAGVPVVGARVALRRAPPRGDGPSGGMRITASAASSDGAGAATFDDGESLGAATTDQQGIAEVRGLVANDAEVRVTHETFAPSEAAPIVVPASGTVDTRVAMARPAFVAVRVLRSDGSVAANTTVLLQEQRGEGAGSGAGNGLQMRFGGGSDQQRATTDAEGLASFGPLRAGSYDVMLSRGQQSHSVGNVMMVFGGDENAIRSSTQEVVVAAGKTSNVDLVYPQLTRVFGTVTGVDGPVAGCVVELGSGDEMPGMPGLGGPSSKTDANGEFAFDDVESGDYVLNFGKEHQLMRAHEPVSVPAGATELRQDLVLRTGTVRVRVMSRADGTPVEKAEVSLERGGKSGAPQRVMMFAVATVDESGGEESMMTFGQQRVKTDADGIATIEDVPVGEYTLKVEQKRFSPASKAEVTVVERQLTDCGTVELDAAGLVRGTVKDDDGNPVAMALVERRQVGETDWSEREVAQGGRFRMSGLSPGRYELRARQIGGQNGPAGEVVEVEVKAGETATPELIAPK